MQKKRIALVTASPMTVNAFLQEHIRSWAKNCHVTVFMKASGREVFDDEALPAELRSVGIERKVSPRKDFLALLALVRQLRLGEFDALVSVTPKAGLLAMLAGWITRVPLRMHIFTGQVWATRTGMSRSLLRLLDRLTASLATDVLADSESQRQFLIAENVVSSRRSAVLGHGSISGVDVARFHPDIEARTKLRAELGLAESDMLLLFLGRLNKDKGVLDLAAAFVSLAATRYQTHLLFVGPDEDGMRDQLQCCCEPAAGRVHFVEYTKTPERYMAAADVFCLPSYREGFGTVVIEAAATGLPAVASRIYGLTDAVLDGVTGVLHHPHDVLSLQLALTRLVDDVAFKNRLGEAARERALRFFSAADVTQAFSEYLFERLERTEDK